MTKVVNYISEAFTELKVNVTWLPWAEVQRLTIIVAVFSVLFSLAIWGIDTVFTKSIAGLFTLIKG
uniref:preprotein translocase subunit SecE n=1 Tax=Flavobacterium sp. TaxID=239 RepID=UPI004049A712